MCADDVTIPRETAREIAAEIRRNTYPSSTRYQEWADALDPQPPSLHRQVYEVLISGPFSPHTRADAVLAVVAERLSVDGYVMAAEYLRGERS